MPDFTAQLKERSEQLWARLNRTQRIAGIALAIAAISGLLLLVVWARTPEYAPAFTNLSDEEAGAIINKLKELNIPYEVSQGTIRVPPASVDEVRMQLATEGLPAQGGIGFEVFNQSTFGMTDFVQKVNYQRALEGELARTITRLDPVDGARVHIVIPQPSLYTEQQREPTASVLVRLKPGRRLDTSQVLGIQHLVSSAVEGLEREQVAVLDTNGNVLSDARAMASGAVSGAATLQSEAQQEFQASLERNIQAMLDQVVGPGRSVVRVAAELNWDTSETTSEIYSPNNLPPQVRSSRELTERSTGGLLTAGGVPGTDSNLPTYQGEDPGAPAESERRDVITNYELSKTVERSVRAPGGISRLSVAVVLDQEATPEQVQQITQLVSAAAGINPQRGDSVIVSGLPFDRSQAEQAMAEFEASRRWELILSTARTVGVVVGPLLALFILWRLMTRRNAEQQPIPGLPHQLPQGALNGPTTLQSMNEPLALAEPPIDPAVMAEHRERARIRNEIVTLAKTNPATLAQLIQTWLEEDVRG